MGTSSEIQEAYDALIKSQNRISGAALLAHAQTGGAVTATRDLIQFVEEMNDAEFALTNALLDAGVIE